jgi:hypothetical protein
VGTHPANTGLVSALAPDQQQARLQIRKPSSNQQGHMTDFNANVIFVSYTEVTYEG